MTADGAYVLAVSTTWPPMAAGSGRAFQQLVAGVSGLVALVPRAPQDVPAAALADAPAVRRVLRHASRAGGPLKVYTVLHHLEALGAPLGWTLRTRRRPDLVLCSVALSVGLGGWLLGRLARVPYVVYAQGEELSGPLTGGRLGQARFRLTRAVLRGAAAVVCISRFTRDLVARDYGIPEARLPLFLPTVDPAEASLEPGTGDAARRALGAGGPLLLMVGRLAQRRKGFDRAIEALPAILARHPAARLVIAGPGDQRELRAAAEAAGVAGAVVFAGEVERARLMALYAACDLFLLPTRTMADGDTEGFGVVFLEANLHGKAVVAGRTGGTADAVVDGQTGLLVDGGDAAAVAAAVTRLLDDPGLAARLGRQGRERVHREFSPAAQQAAFDRLAQELARR
jgi:phosphatidylinositol alpha-1,6-mannosyltransferase